MKVVFPFKLPLSRAGEEHVAEPLPSAEHKNPVAEEVKETLPLLFVSVHPEILAVAVAITEPPWTETSTVTVEAKAGE